MSEKTNYAKYDYTLAIRLYNLDKKFSNFADYIEKYMIENELDPQVVRELCNLSILKAIQSQIFKD